MTLLPKYKNILPHEFIVIEILLGVAIVFICIGLFIHQIPPYQKKIHTLDAMSVLSILREDYDMIYQQTGTFPTQIEDLISFDSKNSDNISLTQGAIHYHFHQHPIFKNQTLSYVLYKMKKASVERFLWQCGYKKPMTSFQSIGQNQTTIKARYLPKFCQDNE